MIRQSISYILLEAHQLDKDTAEHLLVHFVPMSTKDTQFRVRYHGDDYRQNCGCNCRVP